MNKCYSKIIVKGCNLAFWELGKDKLWTCSLECYCGHGRNGFSARKREGDGCTPIGLFLLEMAFGSDAGMETALPYRQIGRDSYWSGEKDDYNSWVEVAPGSRDMSLSEHLADYPVQYRFAMSIGYNTALPEWGKGSAIFLHCKGPSGWPTAGCISVPTPVAKFLVERCSPGSIIQILG